MNIHAESQFHMIVCHKFNFVFMHNPKVGGTSVRAAIEGYSDSGKRFYSASSDPDSPLHQIDRAHIGLDEFAKFYPDIFERCTQARFFALWRQPRARLFSSLQEYSRHFAQTDVRFLSEQERRAFLFKTLDMLAERGRAEDIMDRFELTHFRPQWIYHHSEHHDITVERFELSDMDLFFAEVGAVVGQPDLAPNKTANPSENVALPKFLAGILADNRRKMMLQRIPGMPMAIGLGRKVLAKRSRRPTKDAFALSVADIERVDAFIREFYARDLDVLPVSQV